MNSTENLAIDQNICRTCLRDEELVGIYKNGEEISIFDGVSLAKMLNECTMYPVKSDDLFPKMICLKCVEDVKIAYNFRKQSESSYNSLKALLGVIEKSFNSDTDYKNHKCGKENDKNSKKTSSTSDALIEAINEGKDCLMNIEDDKTQVNENRKVNETDFTNNNDNKDVKNDGNNDDNDYDGSNNDISDLNYDNDNNVNDDSTDEEDPIPSALLKIETEAEELPNDKRNSIEINKYKIEKSPSKEKKSKNTKISSKTSKSHRCETCNKTFARATHLRRHQITHSDVKPYACNVCGKEFKGIDNLKVHELNHTEVKPFECDICNRGFVRSELLKKHKDSCHGDKKPNPKTEYCEICKRYFSSVRYLQTHIKSHKNKRWTCKRCNEQFNVKCDLTEHKKIHKNEKPFLCTECGSRFVKNDYLIIHMRRHKGEKPFKCKFCGKGFPRLTDLTVHERYHTGEKTHLCTICGKGFQRAYNLLVHNRIHTGERPYECPHCSKSFAQKNDLNAHIRHHTGERFKCDICGGDFIQIYHLTRHKFRVHGINVESHSHRVEKFVTPIEQQKQVEALRNKLKKSESLAETLTPTITTTETATTIETVTTTATATTTTATEIKIPQNNIIQNKFSINNSSAATATIPSSVQIFQTVEKLDIDDGDNKDNILNEVKIEKCDLDSN